MNDQTAVQITNVVRVFDGGVIRALDGATVTIRQREYVALTGPSGCGKSTLLHLIAALDTPTSGSIVVNGRDLRHVDGDRYRRSEVGLIFQLHHLLPHLNALQNVEVAMFSNGLSHVDQRGRAYKLLKAVGLENKARTNPPRLAGGERQRLAIARALANEPSIILADEPTGSLDTESAGRVLQLFDQLRRDRGVTILMVTHDAQVASAADRMISMRDGRIVAGPEAGY
jgi:putative ABC transport system ATP-binding protein